jgi:hypothetical protein
VALDGIEWSWPLRVACALRCPWARVRRADMWKTDWSGYQMVYLFQRPESMARAAAKAQAEMAPGTWLVSLEFAVPGVLPHAQLRAPVAGWCGFTACLCRARVNAMALGFPRLVCSPVEGP